MTKISRSATIIVMVKSSPFHKAALLAATIPCLLLSQSAYADVPFFGLSLNAAESAPQEAQSPRGSCAGDLERGAETLLSLPSGGYVLTKDESCPSTVGEDDAAYPASESADDAVLFIEDGFCAFVPVETDSILDYDPLEDLAMDAEADEDALSPVTAELSLYKEYHPAVKTVERNVGMFSKGVKKHFTRALSRSRKYIGMMKEILREEGVPEDIAMLPLIESGFSTSAKSRARAVGPWQFIAGTAKRYGLKIDFWVDERRDPVKSTRAAARYLKDLYAMFDSWALAMAAYNAGEYKVLRAINKTQSNDYWRLVKTRHLRRETKNYVPKFIAATMIAESPEDYGFSDLQYEDALEFDEVLIHAPMTLDVAAQCAGTTTETIRMLNPELVRWVTPPVAKYSLRIPKGGSAAFYEAVSKIPKSRLQTVRPYTVRRGETLSHIAHRTGVSSDAIRTYNKLSKRGVIRSGQVLLIPTGARNN